MGPPFDLVFASPHGAVLRVANFRRGYFDRAAKQIGVPGKERATDARARVGHRNPRSARHLFPDELDDVARRMDDAARRVGVYRTCTGADPTPFDHEGQEAENAV